jgi:hypothetical protein
MPTTEHSDVVFELKEDVNGRPWLMVTFDGPGLTCVRDSDFLGLTFHKSVTIKQAEEFGTFLREMVRGMSLTRI